MHIKSLFITGLLIFSIACEAQIVVGAQFSTLHIPASQFQANGFGIIGAYVNRDVNEYSFSINYFSHSTPTDSIGNIPSGGGNTIYTKYKTRYSFIIFSFNFYRYLIGSNRQRFGLFAGAGPGMARVTQSITSQDINGETNYKNISIEPAFEFLLGGELHLNEVNIFVRGKMSIYVRNLLPVFDATAFPIVTNTQVGFLIPIKSQKK